ncbi:MAG: ShlB/FhaC/HecB family hemolysin secretion/activation protein [Nostocaceae cyanobacterium]|nr:ShlB/FhaC/HecB family hemolysin secretion/activation protein [Nostocaceae cyanobacterium]
MNKKSWIRRSLVLLPSLYTFIAFTSTLAANAQTNETVVQKPNPNQERFAQPLPSPEPLPESEESPIVPISPTPTPTPTSTPDTITIPVRKIEVTGSSILTSKDIEPLTNSVEGRSVTLEELRKVADGISQLYLNRGYITSRAILEEQEIVDGMVKIRVVEGAIEKIEVEGTQRLNPSYIRSRIQLGVGTPLNKDNLEDQLRLLRADPLFTSVEASIKPGSGQGQSIVTVRVKEARAISASVSFDNYAPPSVGSERLGGSISYRNLTGMGDEVSAAYYRSTNGGSNVYDFNYRLPVNAMNGTLQLRVSPSNSKITDSQFAAFGIRSNSELYELSYRQPVIRNPREELALSAGFAVQNGQTFLFNDTPFPFGIGPDADGNSRTRVLKFGQDYVKRDLQGAWAVRSQLNLGLGILDATTNSGSVPDGRFFSWLGQVQRVQQLGKKNLLIAQADVQLSPNSLLPSQQFVVGGGQSVRGYRQNARSGDNGFRLSLENRIAIARQKSGQPVLQLAPFIDMGAVWNHPDNPNKLSNQTFLAGAGLGVIWQPFSNLGLRADYALPLVDLSDKGNNAQDRGFYFSLNYNL